MSAKLRRNSSPSAVTRDSFGAERSTSSAASVAWQPAIPCSTVRTANPPTNRTSQTTVRTRHLDSVVCWKRKGNQVTRDRPDRRYCNAYACCGCADCLYRVAFLDPVRRKFIFVRLQRPSSKQEINWTGIVYKKLLFILSTT